MIYSILSWYPNNYVNKNTLIWSRLMLYYKNGIEFIINRRLKKHTALYNYGRPNKSKEIENYQSL